MQAFEDNSVRLFRADWTNQDPLIGAQLAKLGRQGVPVYVLYKKGQINNPTLLPELLTGDIVMEAIQQITNRELDK